MIEAREVLKKYFGYEEFRSGQESIIEHILNGEDVLGIMPTGAGKSICYQIPAVMLSGITIVVSPLISLMKDQVDGLKEFGIPATFVNSTLSSAEYEQTIENIVHDVYKIIYVAPERLEQEAFLNVLNVIDVSMFTIDEAHCVSQWGHDFRPSYRLIADVIKKLKKRPIVSSFTATATQIVKNDIIKLLDLHSPFVLTTGFDRQNLKFKVENSTKKLEYIQNYLKGHSNSGIIYCFTRKNVDCLHQKLSGMGYSVSKYHGGMNEKERAESQEDFTYDRTQIMVATNAFGMGIDKSNIRFVIHYNMPKDLESYYQEAGRAGRDGEEAECILLFSRADIVDNQFLIENASGENHANEYEKLSDMIDYCNTDKCLRKYILEYFGERPEFDNCGNCSNCLSTIEISDITEESQKILSCIKRMKGNFGASLVTDVLKGANTERIRKLHFDGLSTYGIMKNYTKETIKDFISYLEAEGYLQTVGNEYPIVALTENANDVLFHGKQVLVKKKFEKMDEKEKTPHRLGTQEEIEVDGALFEVLRVLRLKIARENNIPPFIVFADTTLKQMAAFCPKTREEMLKISGVGEVKFEKYGEDFMRAIKEYSEEKCSY
ncbi:MAG: DNA helicase RecQ [Clostridia bacterium]|nr:DNA helicase RecQ [Clostridia bacterium]